MIAKVNDLRIDADKVNAMTNKENKNFENRLRSLAKKQDLQITKKNHATLGMQYWLADNNKLLVSDSKGIDILELRDYLYSEAESQSTDNTELDIVTIEALKNIFSSLELESKYAKMRNDHKLLNQSIVEIQASIDKTLNFLHKIQGTDARKTVEEIIRAYKRMIKENQYFLNNSDVNDKPTLPTITLLEADKKKIH